MSEPTTVQRLAPVFIGVAITGLFLIGLGYLAKQRRDAQPAAQSVVITWPATAASVDSPLVVRFVTKAPLRLTENGWGTGQLHLHARIDNTEHMPAATDITQVADTFVWSFPAVTRGAHSVKIGWADLAHRELSAGASPTIEVTIR